MNDQFKGKALLLATSYFPPAEYFVYLIRHSNVLIDLYETYPKQTWRNRCCILSGNGPVNLSIPVERPHGNHTMTMEVFPSQHSSWQKNHWRSIESAYRNAPFYLYYKDLIAHFFLGKIPQTLAGLNNEILQEICNEIGIGSSISFSQAFITNSGKYTDLRFAISPKAKDRKNPESLDFKPYYQVFEERFGFQPNLSIIDLIFNLGPDTYDYLSETAGSV